LIWIWPTPPKEDGLSVGPWPSASPSPNCRRNEQHGAESRQPVRATHSVAVQGKSKV
jgi:hypothetical protein